ncbi:MAG: D-aminoacyl-tRNA deacylase [Candidatus Cloacimonetes bacterium]|nr:D-aminoacyl-tRNA deacylase [Candidatus Cloacimonadota bacterium]
MRITLQRVSSATCRVENQVIGEIGSALLPFVGFSPTDTSGLSSIMVG